MKFMILSMMLLSIVATMSFGCATNGQVNDDPEAKERQILRNVQDIETATRLGIKNGFKFAISDIDQRKDLADKVQKALNVFATVVDGEWNSSKIQELIEQFATISPDIKELAEDAFVLFDRWVTLPSADELVSKEVAEYLRAFARGGIQACKDILNE